MILHQPEKIIADQHIKISARFEMDKPLPDLPEKLWYSFPEKYSDIVNTRSDAFAPTALLVAMYAGEDLEVRGELSPMLAENLIRFRDQYVAWRPDLFHGIHLKVDILSKPPVDPDHDMYLTSFSGGIDSMYTLMDSLKGHSGNAPKLTHGIFIAGLDMRLDDQAKYDDTFQAYNKLFTENNRELIRAASNIYQFSQFRISWRLFYSPATVSIAHLLSSRVRCFYLPSTKTVEGMVYYGSSTPVTPYFETEAIKISSHGFGISRFGKLDALIEWPEAHHKIRVCADKLKLDRLQNCSRCHKCYSAKMWIKLRGGEENNTNFEYKMSLLDYLHWGNQPVMSVKRVRLIQELAREKGEMQIVRWIEIALFIQWLRKTTINILYSFLKPEWVFRLKRRIYRPEFGTNANREVPN